ncbi:hypothetical protein CfE428DRAFT_2005 [Chthoniobacter flavus Ellin428]|uniref:Uncharacterized protein n=1 Tax=Chthoniobacter flavus Ellin428 TaxID=497964 RepID=B4CZB7_9BACT|nr:outer membrane beta-barrel protein [Chthoniobacter flavus]EDY20808.1 hypothetical protein CfE428DRAFT_2005 [Chthoniobacter flavus Ellin428]TCO89699.1 putative beta-barrel porin 2 [Chthoniobacter flavus]
MKARFVPPTLLLLLGICGSLLAQDGKTYTYHTQGSLAQSSKQSAQEVEDIGQIDEEGGSTTLRDKLRFNINFQTAYTTNALLQGNHGSGDVLFLPSLDVGFHTALSKHFNFDLDTKVDSVIYSRFQDRGIVGYSAQATLDYHIKQGLPRFYATLEPYRYESFDTGQLQTEAIGFTGGTDWGVPFNGGRTLGFVGYSFTEYLADPDIDTRMVHRAVVGLAHQIRTNLTLQLYYVYQFSDYTDFDRSDSKHTISGNLIYQFNDHWYGSFTTSFINNGSTQEHAAYQSFSTSLGLSLHF